MHRCGIGAALLGIAALAGCGGGSSPSAPSDPPLVNSPDDVVEDLAAAWNGRDADALAVLLADGFVFHVSPADAESAGVPESWGRETDLVAAANLFRGEVGVGPDGTPQPAADTRFSFGLTITPEDEWAMREEPPHEGTFARTFRNVMTVQYEDFNLDFITGRQVFFVGEEPGTDGSGAPIRRYRLQAWQDLGQIERHQAFTWGFLKSMYREVYAGGEASVYWLPARPPGTNPPDNPQEGTQP